jgi:hypothetical protein
MKNVEKVFSRYTIEEEQKRGMKIPGAPPRSEWMTIDECFDDVIDSVKQIY